MGRLLRRRRPAAAPAGDRAPRAATLNPPRLAPLVLEGVILHRHLSALGLPVPRLFGVVGRAGGYGAAGGRPLPDIDAVLTFLTDGVPDRFVVRPSSAAAGAPTRVLRRDGDEVVDALGGRTTVALLAAELLDGPADMHLVQERLRNHPDWGAGGGLTPLRLTTLVDTSGGVAVVDARPRPNSPPPYWDAAHALVRGAAPQLMPLRCLVWSLGLTREGPRILDVRPRRLPLTSLAPRPAPIPGAVALEQPR